MKASIGEVIRKFILRLVNDDRFARKAGRIALVMAILLLGLVYFKFVFPLVLLLAAFVYKFVACRTFFDYTGFDPFMFLSFYVGYAYGTWAGLIFGFLFGLSYALAQINPSMRIFWFIPICTLIGLFASLATFAPLPMIAYVLIFGGALLDIIMALTFVGPIPQLFIWHAGHTTFVILLVSLVLKHLPGI